MTPLLPVVHEDIWHGMLATAVDEGKEYAFQCYEVIREENPILFNLIIVVLEDDTKSESFKEGYCRAALHIYTALRTQAECDLLEESE